MKFSYQRFEADPTYADPNPYIDRPVIPIRIIGVVDSIDLGVALLDTGAEESILPWWIVEEIQPAFRPNEMGSIETFSNESVEVVYGTVDFEMRLDHRDIRWHAKVGFSKRLRDPLLGFKGFVEFFTASFNGPMRTVALRANGEFPKAIMPGAQVLPVKRFKKKKK